MYSIELILSATSIWQVSSSVVEEVTSFLSVKTELAHVHEDDFFLKGCFSSHCIQSYSWWDYEAVVAYLYATYLSFITIIPLAFSNCSIDLPITFCHCPLPFQHTCSTCHTQ